MQSLNELQIAASVEPLRLLRMSSTRWNAAFLVMRRASLLAHHIHVACAMNDKQTNVDFTLLPHAVALLSPVYKVTKRM
jgi:hypothetical protein